MTNWSSRAYSRTRSACQAMNSVVSFAWKPASKIVLGLPVAVGCPQVGPRGELVG